MSSEASVCNCLMLGSKRVELHTVKRGVVKALPKTKKFKGIAISHPVLYGKAWVIAVAVAGNVSQRNVLIAITFCIDSHINSLYV